MTITSAARPHSEELRGRERRYIFSMGIRTACFLLALVFIDHWVTWVFVFGAVFLPYVAVVIANAGASTDPARDDHAFDPGLKALGPGLGAGTGPVVADLDR